MKRLTAWKDGHAYYKKCFEEPCLGSGCKIEDCELECEVCKMLARYEETGLTPYEIREVDRLYLEKCEEVNRLKDALENIKAFLEGLVE
jgi:hypothetical protein